MDHSWTLQAVMQMQKDLGVLCEKIDRMREDFGELKADSKATRDLIIDIDKSRSSFQGGMKVLGVIYTLVLVIIGGLLAWLLGS